MKLGDKVKAYISKLEATILGEIVDINLENKTVLLRFISSKDSNMLINFVKKMKEYNVRISINSILK